MYGLNTFYFYFSDWYPNVLLWVKTILLIYDNQQNGLNSKNIFELSRLFCYICGILQYQTKEWTLVIPWREHSWLIFKLDFVIWTNDESHINCSSHVLDIYASRQREELESISFGILMKWQKAKKPHNWLLLLLHKDF